MLPVLSPDYGRCRRNGNCQRCETPGSPRHHARSGTRKCTGLRPRRFTRHARRRTSIRFRNCRGTRFRCPRRRNSSCPKIDSFFGALPPGSHPRCFAFTHAHFHRTFPKESLACLKCNSASASSLSKKFSTNLVRPPPHRCGAPPPSRSFTILLPENTCRKLPVLWKI